MDLSIEDIRLLAKQQREMDEGLVPHVVLNGQRLAMMPDIMTELGLIVGQTIDDFLFTAILKANIALLETKIAMGKITSDKKD